MRGEYSSAPERRNIRTELPLRARRIRQDRGLIIMAIGTTSACAENTGTTTLVRRVTRNYLRVRGEYALMAKEAWDEAELPPRARRILFLKHLIINRNGTTSACAENTPSGDAERGC